MRDGNGIVIATYDEMELRQRITRPGLRNDHATPQLVAPGMRTIVNVWIAVPPASGFVRSLSHVVDLDLIRPSDTIRARASGGLASIPGRFAIDFITLPHSGALPAVRASDANGFGADVLAVAVGTITIAVDGLSSGARSVPIPCP